MKPICHSGFQFLDPVLVVIAKGYFRRPIFCDIVVKMDFKKSVNSSLKHAVKYKMPLNSYNKEVIF